VLRLIDGWDAVFGNDQVQLKYPQSYITFLQQGGIAGGAPGPVGSSATLDRGEYIFNTAFGEATFQRTFDQQPTWTVAFDFQMGGVGSGNPYPIMEFFRLSFGPKPAGIKLLSMTTTAAGLVNVTFYDGTSSENTLATFTSSQALTPNQWKHMDITATFTGSGSFSLRFFDAFSPTVVAMSTGVGISGPYPMPDTVTPARWEGFGPPGVAIDNLVIYDGQNNGDGFVSPTANPQQRITTVIPASDLPRGDWTPFIAAPTLSQDAVNPLRFNTPMSDYDYATPNNANALQLFTFGSVPCYGQINAIALNYALKAVPPISTLPQITAAIRELISINSAGVLTALNLFPSSIGSLTRGYWIVQAIAAFSLQTGATWKANDLSQISIGMISDPLNTPERVSALFLEVLTDVSGLPYTCGGVANYSFQ
jgi:hypothetical protein